MKNILKIFTLLSAIFLFSCGGGIEPEPENLEKEGFGGVITFEGEWPADISRTHLVIFKSPLNSVEDFNIFNLGFVSLEIPYGVTQFRYSTADSALFPINAKLAPGSYSYVAVAQQNIEEISLNREDWFVVGYYTAGGDTIPGVVSFSEGEYLENINILCDFDNPPPQPPGKNND
jgi:hypothetical protein